jgi:hypothetical protein
MFPKNGKLFPIPLHHIGSRTHPFRLTLVRLVLPES